VASLPAQPACEGRPLVWKGLHPLHSGTTGDSGKLLQPIDHIGSSAVTGSVPFLRPALYLSPLRSHTAAFLHFSEQ
jgi:hypothetical protein